MPVSRYDRLDDESTARLVTEARAMAKLSHHNVVSVYDVEENEAGEVMLVMEYVAGRTLEDWLQQQRRSMETAKSEGPPARPQADTPRPIVESRVSEMKCEIGGRLG